MTKNTSTNKLVSAWFMWGIAALFYAFRYLVDVCPSVIANDLMRSLSVNAAMLGNLAAFFLYSYAAMQIPVGVLLDRFGAKKLLTAAALISSVGSLIFASANVFGIAAFGRLLIGIGAAFPAVGSMYVASKWLPINRFALATGLLLTVGMVGAIGGSAPLALLVSVVHWRPALFILSGGGFVITILLWLFIKDKKAASNTKTVVKENILAGLKNVMKNKQSWLLAIYAGLIFMTMSIFGSLWGVPFLMSKYNCSNAHAASLMMVFYVGFAFGAPFFGWLSDRIRARKPIAYSSSIGTTISTLILLYWPHLPQFFAGCALFAFSFFIGAMMIAYTSIIECNSRDYSGSALGFMNMLNMIGGAAGLPLVGLILDWQWNGTLDNGAHVYSLGNYQIALAILPAVLLLSVFFLIPAKETYSHQRD